MSKPMSIGTALLTAVIASSLSSAPTAFSQPPANKADAIRLSLQSVYLPSPIEKFSIRAAHTVKSGSQAKSTGTREWGRLSTPTRAASIRSGTPRLVALFFLLVLPL